MRSRTLTWTLAIALIVLALVEVRLGAQARPAQLAQKPLLSDDELTTLERRAGQLFGPDAESWAGFVAARSWQ
jgi:hypothetical protein